MHDCVEWTGGVMAGGYGQFYKEDRVREYAHRQAWMDAKGPIPEGMHVHHLCSNRLCVNVDHLELLSNADHHGARGHGKLTRGDAETIRSLLRAGHRVIDVAAAFGVAKGHISQIGSGKTWA
jgi:hypothetical protein